MKEYREKKFSGERALFQTNDAKINYCTFLEGESPLKESKRLNIKNTLFQWKYPLWYCEDVTVEDSTMFEMARAGIWYTNNLTMKNITYNAPKGFRRCENVTLENITIPNASETLWNCKNVKIKNITAKGNYFAMGVSEIEIDNYSIR